MTALASSEFGVKELEKYGWSLGKGLGAMGSGIIEPIKASMKMDMTGLGFDQSKEFTDFWWDHLYSKSAKNVLHIDDCDDSISIIDQLISTSDSPASYIDANEKNTTNSVDENSNTKKETALYPNFVKGTSSSLACEEQEDFPTLNFDDEAVFKGNVFNYKTNRHGITMSGKLGRLERQEQQFDNLANISLLDSPKKRIRKYSASVSPSKLHFLQDSDVMNAVDPKVLLISDGTADPDPMHNQTSNEQDKISPQTQNGGRRKRKSESISIDCFDTLANNTEFSELLRTAVDLHQIETFGNSVPSSASNNQLSIIYESLLPTSAPPLRVSKRKRRGSRRLLAYLEDAGLGPLKKKPVLKPQVAKCDKVAITKTPVQLEPSNEEIDDDETDTDEECAPLAKLKYKISTQALTHAPAVAQSIPVSKKPSHQSDTGDIGISMAPHKILQMHGFLGNKIQKIALEQPLVDKVEKKAPNIRNIEFNTNTYQNVPVSKESITSVNPMAIPGYLAQTMSSKQKRKSYVPEDSSTKKSKKGKNAKKEACSRFHF